MDAMVTVDLAQPDLRHAFLGTLEIVADSCPRLVVPGGLLPINDQIALGYRLDLIDVCFLGKRKMRSMK